MNAVVNQAPALLKLNLGCGKSKLEGYLGVDRRSFEGVDVVTDLLDPWPWETNSVSDIHMSHVLEHFTGPQRVYIFNEMYRVLVPDGKAHIITPYWASNRAYGDFTHQWPPVSEMLYYYLSQEWRSANAPDNDILWNPEGYACDFAVTWGYGLHPEITLKNQAGQTFALTFYKEAAQDLYANAVAKKPKAN
jgi:hypothetical protein